MRWADLWAETSVKLPEPNLVLLHRVNPKHNEARYYLVQVGPTFFEPHAVLRVWGRIGGGQRRRLSTFATQREAVRFAQSLIRRRQQHGYQLIQNI